MNDVLRTKFRTCVNDENAIIEKNVKNICLYTFQNVGHLKFCVSKFTRTSSDPFEIFIDIQLIVANVDVN